VCEVGRVFPRHVQRTCLTGESPLSRPRVARTLRLYNYLLRFHLTTGPHGPLARRVRYAFPAYISRFPLFSIYSNYFSIYRYRPILRPIKEPFN
jgi:hypothetical protein